MAKVPTLFGGKSPVMTSLAIGLGEEAPNGVRRSQVLQNIQVDGRHHANDRIGGVLGGNGSSGLDPRHRPRRGGRGN